ncbi:MAG: hypothetical protein ACK49R_03215, partial [Planctomycetota bacterium]
MAGLHFYCGKWLGEDKSANPIFDVIDDVREFVSSGADDQSIEDFFREWDAQLENDKIKLTEKQDIFRGNLLSYLGAYSLDNPDKKIKYTEVFPDIVKSLKESYR